MSVTLRNDLYERELSWLDFNERVLEEAYEKENPLMERLRFLAITASNLDEFMMVRVAGVKEHVEEHDGKVYDSDLTAEELLPLLQDRIRAFMERQYSCLFRSIQPLLEKAGIRFLAPEELDERQARYAANYFEKVIFPVLTPMAVDRSRPFPRLANKSLNIAVRLRRDGEEDAFAVVQVPSILPRFLELPSAEGRAFILQEQIIGPRLTALFQPHKILSHAMFRITRNSDLDIDEENEDFLAEIRASIRKRKDGRPVRLELDHDCDKEITSFLREMLELKKSDLFPVQGPLDLTFLSKFASIDAPRAMSFQPIVPVSPPADFMDAEDIFAAIRERDCMVHHPYESFDAVLHFVQAAADDPDVLAIKQTLYRVSGKSPIIDALVRAAENGKQVTVLVELKARFDEENNLHWAKKLEKAGCHVVYGLAGLKTHCKICLVVRREEDGIRRYVHMGTGNYNDSTAKIYTDLGIFTCKEPYGADASSLFNVLTGYSIPPRYNRFVVAPQDLRPFFASRIRREIDCAKEGLPSGITAKLNSLVDPGIVRLLYEASQAGVKIRLIVRGICCLLPGRPGLSENIEVHSIVGQLLEHSRIFRFENGGDVQIYMGSADWMQRNLDRRVELVFPVEEELQARAAEILEIFWKDTVNTRIMYPDTHFELIDRRGRKPVNCQRVFSQMAQQAARRDPAAQTTQYKVRRPPEG